MTRKLTATTLPQPERRTRTQAAVTTTALEDTKTKPRTVQDVLADQNRAAKSDLTPATPTPETLPALTGTTSPEALDRHLAEWSGGPLTGLMFSFNGNTGEYVIISDGTKIPVDSEFIGVLDQTRKGWIKFNDGEAPTTVMIGIAEDAELPERDELGDTDPELWEPGLDGQPRDPWQIQYVVPAQRPDSGGELYAYVARSITAMNAVEGLLGRYRWHPRSKAGFLPIVKFGSGTYKNKKFNTTKPKPILTITGWVNRDGTPITAMQKKTEFDDVPY